MSRPRHLFVFCYDVERDRDRVKLSDLLEEAMVRVQKSVFEGYLTSSEADRLGRRAEKWIGPDDSLRVYCISEGGRRQSRAYGAGNISEASEFWIV